MAKKKSVLERMSAICLALPDTKLTMTWDKPHFRVGEKIFAGCGETHVGMKLHKDHAAALCKSDARVVPAKYVGKHGWVSIDVSGKTDWEEIRNLVMESYELIAPKRSLKKLDG